LALAFQAQASILGIVQQTWRHASSRNPPSSPAVLHRWARVPSRRDWLSSPVRSSSLRDRPRVAPRCVRSSRPRLEQPRSERFACGPAELRAPKRGRSLGEKWSLTGLYGYGASVDTRRASTDPTGRASDSPLFAACPPCRTKDPENGCASTFCATSLGMAERTVSSLTRIPT
jgi:hypothetical protein